MIELPEAAALAQQINETVKGRRITNVTAAASPHKFAWFFGDPQNYHSLLTGKAVGKATGFGGMLEIEAEDAVILLGDGVTVRFHGEGEARPVKHQLLIEFEDHSAISGSVQMYGGLWCFRKGENDNPYYKVAKEKPSPLSGSFDRKYFEQLISPQEVQKLSAKAFLATEQRIPGLGNGVLQDILFNCGIHPKRKIQTLSPKDRDMLFDTLKTTLAEMTFQGGRDTERDLSGCFGGYKAKLSKNTAGKPCPNCGGSIVKEAYLGGSIYYCAVCQPLPG